jgi:hypothetical protein
MLRAKSIRRTVEDFDEFRPVYLDPTATVLSGNAEIEDFSYLDNDDDWWVREGWTAKASAF